MHLKKKLSYNGKKVFVGIDVHRRTYWITCKCDGEIVKKCEIEASPAKLLAFLRKHFVGAKIFSVYEAGFSCFVLHRYLKAEGIDNIIVNPGSISVSANDRVKTDKRDSLKQATQLANGSLSGIRIPEESQEQSRLLTRSREQLVRDRTRIRNQLRFKLHQFGLIPVEHKNRLTQKFVNEIMKEHKTSREFELVVDNFLLLWTALDEQIKRLEDEMALQAKECPLEKIYRSASGIGPIAARVLINELGDMRQFKNERALFSYTGLTPAEYSSGEHRRLGHISRQGNARVRGILTECAWTAIVKDKKLKADFARISKRAGRKRAIVAIARKLIGRIRAAINKGELYEPGYGMPAS